MLTRGPRPESNTRGPLGNHSEKPIVYLNGSEESYQNSYTKSQDEFDREQKASRGGEETRQSVRTADNEQASWVALLMAVQRMEKESRAWQDDSFFRYKPPEPAGGATTPHTLTVALQRKRRSWDSMPDSLKKPYATTNIAHLVEVLAMLGIYWREFDRTDNVYRAQGNGFSVVGTMVDELGIAFTFQKVGPTWFQENRMVPHNSCKELCFGFCPTIFRRSGDSNWRYADEPKDSGTLQLGSLHEIAETLVTLGCNANTVNRFRKDAATSRHSHLFALPFEMLGMVGRVLQIENTAFNMLPNPTVFHWDKTSFSLRRLLKAYSHALREARVDDALLTPAHARLQTLLDAAAGVEKHFADQEAAAANEAAAAAGATVVPGTPRKSFGEKPSVPGIMAALHAAIRGCDAYLTVEANLPLVMHVLHAHLQEVLRVLNTPRDESTGAGTGGSSSAPEGAPPPVDSSGRFVQPTTDDLDKATPGKRHRLLAQLYVFWIRPAVVRAVCDEVQSEEAHAHRVAVGTSPTDPLMPVFREGRVFEEGVAGAATDAAHRQAVNDVWCALVFRMICWLLLHDFHKKDIQISKSELFGSRQPVYLM